MNIGKKEKLCGNTASAIQNYNYIISSEEKRREYLRIDI